MKTLQTNYAETPMISEQRKEKQVHSLEWLALAAILLATNVRLPWGEVHLAGVYFPQGGGGWTLLTHPFVHVSTYHLLLDAGAFIFLYHALGRLPFIHRIGAVLLCGLGSWALAVAFTPDLYYLGFCGLSGIGHGLMAIVGLLSLKDRNADPLEHRIMGGLLLALLAKVIYESLTGQVFFAASHFGDIGTPITICHLGGVLGGLLACWLVETLTFLRDRSRGGAVSLRN